MSFTEKGEQLHISSLKLTIVLRSYLKWLAMKQGMLDFILRGKVQKLLIDTTFSLLPAK